MSKIIHHKIIFNSKLSQIIVKSFIYMDGSSTGSADGKELSIISYQLGPRPKLRISLILKSRILMEKSMYFTVNLSMI